VLNVETVKLMFSKSNEMLDWLQIVEIVDQLNSKIGAFNVDLEITNNNIEIVCKTSGKNKKDLLNYLLILKLSTDTFNKLCKEVKYESDTHPTS
jgi:hypothetical protein